MSMRAVWSPVNLAFLVLFGDAPCGIGPEGRILFGTREELRSVVEACGLRLTDETSFCSMVGPAL